MMPGSVDLTERRVRNDPFQKTTFGKNSFWSTKQRNKMETVWCADIGCRTCFRKRRTKGKLLDGLQFTNWTCAPCRWRRFQMPWSFHKLKERNVAFDAMQLSKRTPQSANQTNRSLTALPKLEHQKFGRLWLCRSPSHDFPVDLNDAERLGHPPKCKWIPTCTSSGRCPGHPGDGQGHPGLMKSLT